MMLLSINLVYMLQAEPFEKNYFDLLWHYIRYITKSTPYKIEVLTVVVYFIAFLHVIWRFICIGCLVHSIIFHTKQIWNPISFVVCLQQFVKHINPQVQPCHLNVSFLPYRCIKAVIILSYHCECSSFLYTLLKYYKYKYLKFYFTFQNIFSASNVHNNT